MPFYPAPTSIISCPAAHRTHRKLLPTGLIDTRTYIHALTHCVCVTHVHMLYTHSLVPRPAFFFLGRGRVWEPDYTHTVSHTYTCTVSHMHTHTHTVRTKILEMSEKNMAGYLSINVTIYVHNCSITLFHFHCPVFLYASQEYVTGKTIPIKSINRK